MVGRLAQGDATAATKLASVVAKQEVQRVLKKRKATEVEDDFLSSADDQVFGGAPALGSGSSIMMIHQKEPGRLYQNSLEELSRFLSTRVGATGSPEETHSFLTYLTAVFFGHHPPEKIGAKTAAEMRTLAMALDCLGRGDLPSLGDLLAQRFKALETSVVDGSWSVARRLELVPQDAMLASTQERKAAAKEELLYAKLAETGRKKR